MAETPLEMCRRHVTEGAGRIARQEDLIVELSRNGHEHLLPDARALLATLQATQKLGEEHLAREIAKHEGVAAYIAETEDGLERPFRGAGV